MSAVIKSADAAGISAVRALPRVAVVPPPSALEEERERVRARMATLESELRQHETRIAELHKDVTDAFARGTAEGYQSGFDAAERRDTERLALLERTMQSALAEFSSSLSSLERLAPLLAQDSLELILGDAAYRRELLEKIILKQTAAIEKSLLIRIVLSREDFPDEDGLSALAQRITVPWAMLTASPDMASGGCRITLRLGSQEIGIAQQWGAVQAMLTQLSLPEAPP